MTVKEQKKQERIIFERLPREAEFVVKSNPDKKKEVDKIVEEIFEHYGEDISALAKS